MSSSPLFVADSLDAWIRPESSQYNGCLLTRPGLCEKWDIQADIDDCAEAGGAGLGEDLLKEVTNGEPEELMRNLQSAADEIVAKASLPNGISQQIREDICAIGSILGQICSNRKLIQVRLQILGEGVCSRWHRDTYVGRAIVSYNSHATVYTADSNVDMWELENCGNNKCIIRDTNEIRNVGVGDVLFMKGRQFPNSTGLVHKSPEVRYHQDGRVVNRLVLKIDVPLSQEEQVESIPKKAIVDGQVHVNQQASETGLDTPWNKDKIMEWIAKMILIFESEPDLSQRRALANESWMECKGSVPIEYHEAMESMIEEVVLKTILSET